MSEKACKTRCTVQICLPKKVVLTTHVHRASEINVGSNHKLSLQNTGLREILRVLTCS